MTHTRIPRLAINLEAITTHLNTLAACPHCDAAVAGDIADLLTETGRLYKALLDTRLRAANLRAAIAAALHAHADGEADPLAYLRDELADQGWCA